MVCAGDNEQLLVVPGQLIVRRFAEIARVCLSAMHQQHSRSDLAAALQDRHIQERKRSGHVPTIVGVQAAGMIAAGRFVVRKRASLNWRFIRGHINLPLVKNTWFYPLS